MKMKVEPPPHLMEEIVEEILLRFPPQEPVSLVRAALVCKAWSRIVSGRGFRSRFCKLHRTPPMLGFLCNHDDWSDAARFVPTTARFPFPLPHATAAGRPDRRAWHALDARHGRVVLKQDSREEDIVVWDPVTDAEKKLPIPHQQPAVTGWTAAVLCAAAAAAAARGGCDCDCDHLDCHFIVVFACSTGGDHNHKTFIYTYSSEADKWSEPISGSQPDDSDSSLDLDFSPSVLVENAIYFGIPSAVTALKYDLESREMSWIELPSVCSVWQRSVLTATEEGGLGLLTIGDEFDDSNLYMWLREGNNPHVVDAAEWTHNKGIDLKPLLPVEDTSSLQVLGIADGVGIVFLRLHGVIYAFDLKTSKMEVLKLNGVHNIDDLDTIHTIVPYMSFYTPAKAASTGVGPSAGGSRTT